MMMMMMMMQYTKCVVKAHKVQTNAVQVQILMTCPMRNKIRLQTFTISCFWLLSS